jgi:hypothetical protein
MTAPEGVGIHGRHAPSSFHRDDAHQSSHCGVYAAARVFVIGEEMKCARRYPVRREHH